MEEENLKKLFVETAKSNLWGDKDSLSGPGSNLIQTAVIREKIPELVKKYKVKSMLDAPCGDLFWMSKIINSLAAQLDRYTGADLVEDIILENKQKFGTEKIHFMNLNLAENRLEKFDLIFTRDCFIHLSYENIYRILKNYKRSGSHYLLLSTYVGNDRINRDVKSQQSLDFRALNMQKKPFFFKAPIEVINEACTENEGKYADKSLALWKVNEIKLSGLFLYIHFQKAKAVLKKILLINKH